MCTVKTRKKSVDALALIVEQHERIDELIAQIERENLIERKQVLFDELAATVAAHAAMKERLFYPAVRAAQTQEFLLDTTQIGVKRALARLLGMDVDEPDFDTRLAVLAHEIEHQARDQEEQILLPKLSRLWSEEQREALGIEMQALYDRLLPMNAGVSAAGP